jgi:hypothetical protein
MRSLFGAIAARLFPRAKPQAEDSAPFAVSLWEGGDRLGAFADDLPDTGIHAGGDLPAQRDDFS